jgi:glycosyltransferase involved in cell wall biosynthesis
MDSSSNQTPLISFIIPAHNEEACLGPTLQAIHDTAGAIGHPYEIVVANDASTDATAEIARQKNARMVNVNHRQIAATRNSGARAAKGERFVFVDADTIVNPRAVSAALRKMDKGAVGGGAPTWVAMSEQVPLYGRLLFVLVLVMPKLTGFSGGAFLFCKREAFEATGGFNERMFFGEENPFVMALRREGWFAGLWQPVLTSGRRLRKTSGLKLLGGLVRILFSPVKMFTHRSGVETIWYDSNRKDDDVMPNSWWARIDNGITFLVMLVVLSVPIWIHLPWSWTPMSTPLGKIRWATYLVIVHLVLIVFAPVAVTLLVNLLRQKRFTGIIQSAVLIYFFGSNAWAASHVVFEKWAHFYHWLA